VSTVQDRVEHKNVTLSLPEDLLRKFRVYAASQNKSMSHLMTLAIERMLADEGKWDLSKRRMIERMRNATDRGTNGVITWTRDEIHER
jgi:DNA-binding transcriptional MocR family regulator